MAFYNVCEKCGAHLDPGEHCDCESEKKRQKEFYSKRLWMNAVSGQYAFCWAGYEKAGRD